MVAVGHRAHRKAEIFSAFLKDGHHLLAFQMKAEAGVRRTLPPVRLRRRDQKHISYFQLLNGSQNSRLFAEVGALAGWAVRVEGNSISSAHPHCFADQLAG